MGDGAHGTRLTRRGRIVAVGLVATAVLGSVVAWRAADRGSVDPARAAPAPLETATSSPAPPAPRWGPAVRARSDGPAPDVAALVESAPVVVVAGTEPADVWLAEVAARRLHAPAVRVLPADLADRWETEVVVVVGAVAPTAVPGGLERRAVTTAPQRGVTETIGQRSVLGAGLPARADALHPLADLESAASPPPQDATAVVIADEIGPLQRRTLAAVGLAGVAVPQGDPRAVARQVAGLPVRAAAEVIPVGDWSAADLADLGWRWRTARTGTELPGGGQLLFPGRRLVALYGHPSVGALGVLGEQGPREAVVRAREVSAPYAAHSDVPVVPTFELIATVASHRAEPTGDYSRRTSIEVLRPWVDVAREAGLYVVLDLQPGRTHFLDQAKEYEELLREPHVGLALDPEWRIGPREVHLRRIGSVTSAEVNEVAGWLAALTREHQLPQKLLVIHQFTRGMIGDRSALAAPSELAVVIHMDGQGGALSKVGTYRSLVEAGPLHPAIRWGWKHFYDEDRPVRTPAATFDLEPVPWFISYQ